MYIISCKEKLYLTIRHHDFIFKILIRFLFAHVESFKSFKIQMNINRFITLRPTYLWYILKQLGIPTFTYPTNIFRYFISIWIFSLNSISFNSLNSIVDWMRIANTVECHKSFAINIWVVCGKMQSVYRLI